MNIACFWAVFWSTGGGKHYSQLRSTVYLNLWYLQTQSTHLVHQEKQTATQQILFGFSFSARYTYICISTVYVYIFTYIYTVPYMF